MRRGLLNDLANNRALWLGIGVGIAFRIFAYGLLSAASSIDLRGHPSTAQHIFPILYGLVALLSPFWVPFAAGFSSSYFWGTLRAYDYVRAIWTSAVGFLVAFMLLAVAFVLPQATFSLIFLVCLDVGVCGKGVDQGTLFWNGRLGRQLLGDFSTRDEKDAV